MVIGPGRRSAESRNRRRRVSGSARPGVDTGQRPETTTDESAELKRLRRDNAELRRAGEITNAASASAEFDRPCS